jgi:protein tyrosine phosphatase (PTP) superfamily phosphohydrolase (DUF442 family)
MALLVAVSLAQMGCQSGLSNPCGPCSRLRTLSARMFQRPVPVSEGCCGAAPAVVGSDVPVINPGAPAVIPPASSGATVLPSVPSAPSAPTESMPSQLEPIPQAQPGPPAEASPSQGAKSSSGKINYEATRPRSRMGIRRGENLARTMTPIPVPTSRSARGATSPGAVLSEPSPLDNLPPLETPKELTRNDRPLSAGPAPEAEQRPNATIGPAAPSEVPSASVIDSPPASTPAPEEVRVQPGLLRFLVVEPKLAGGSLPTTVGLDWLAEKGYKTILDLREIGEVDRAFLSEVDQRGMRYVALPIGLKTLDLDHVARFNFELTLADARPLYFCDTDGNRAGALWYIRRMTVDKVDPQAATREAKDLGLTDKGYWRAVTTLLEGIKPAVPAQGAAPAPTPAAAATPPPAALPRPVTPTAKPQAAAEPSKSPTDVSQTPEIPASPVATRDSTGWSSFIALFLTGMGVPLAYFSRSTFPSFRFWKRASLPGPGRRLRSLPPASGE